ncbi:protein FAM221B-like [Clytia hemisphaerica]|uniref:protein FAM221B-like n=1 Tax=Clytia hemisphaerica TaxID=252671 RepID=UPI0034D3B235
MNGRGYQKYQPSKSKKRPSGTKSRPFEETTTQRVGHTDRTKQTIICPRKPPRRHDLPSVNPTSSRSSTESRVIGKPSTALIQQRHYTVKPIIPARKKELISVAKAMHRDDFSPRLRNLYQRETNAAVTALEQGLYIGWRCPEFTWDCIRLDSKSRCFCDHNLDSHEPFKGGKTKKLKCLQCPCKSFNFIPQRPEDIGEWWLRRRPGFNEAIWRAKCRCKHTHVEHNPETRKCRVRGCGCFRFESNFLCAACDRHLEEHSTFFENADIRRQQGLPCGEDYLPFNELPDLRNICLTGSADNSTRFEGIASGPYAIPPKKEETGVGRFSNDSVFYRR